MKDKYQDIHVVPLFSALDDYYIGTREQRFSPCERPCVCHCVCRHGGSAALDFNGEKILEGRIEKLFAESLEA